ncbi:MAG: hypothetical protein LBR29_05600, partial [Methylobacteriaceae bacterium]|nr:hypothetical protein [Methylobacteriaceae bacterium]
IEPHTELENAVRAVKDKPTILSLTHDIADAHPVVRNVGGRYVGSFLHMFGFIFIDPVDFPLILQDDYGDLPAAKREYFERERENALYQVHIAARDIRERRPDIILMSRVEEWKQFLMMQPDMKQALADYEYVSTADNVEVWKRKEKTVPLP